jgi:hypothetical protein
MQRSTFGQVLERLRQTTAMKHTVALLTALLLVPLAASSIVRLKDGSSLGLFHRGGGIGEEGTLQVLQSITRDPRTTSGMRSNAVCSVTWSSRRKWTARASAPRAVPTAAR